MMKARKVTSEKRGQVKYAGSKAPSPGDERFWIMFYENYLTPHQIAATECYRRASEYISKDDPDAIIPTYAQVIGDIRKQDRAAVCLARGGEKAIRKCLSGYVLPYNHATQQCKAVRAKVNQHIITLDPEVNFLQECRIKCILAEIEGIIHAAGKPTEQILILYKPEYLAAGDQDRIEYKVAEINAIIKDKNIK